jgi:hypothetical protein
VIDGNVFSGDVIILPERVLPNWWRVQGHTLSGEDLQQALNAAPEILIVGRGMYGRMGVPDAVREALDDAGVELIDLGTREACEVYNQVREERRVVAALHLTC